MKTIKTLAFGLAVVASATILNYGCSGGSPSSGFDRSATDSGGQGDETGIDFDAAGSDVTFGPLVDSGKTTQCVGLQCRQTCATTTISGKVYDPAGNNGIYNVVVYVPNSPLKPLPSGASCESCNALYSGNPIAVGVTDEAGNFTVTNAPEGANVPLVVQIGKWRKQYTIPNVVKCVANAQPDKSIRLPKNRTDGDQGGTTNIPNIAISTGSADTLECLLRRVGLDASEYGGGTGGQNRIHIFTGGGPNTSPAGPASNAGLWNSSASLMGFDMVLLSCEGSETGSMNQQALHDYATAGGRVFASHFHYAWFNTGPYGSENLAKWTTGTQSINNINGSIVTTLPNGQPFPKGNSLKTWLGNVGALTGGKLPIVDAKHNADVSATNTSSQAWITGDVSGNPTQYFSFNTPTNAPIGDAGVPNYCGRVVFSDLHVGAASGDTGGTVPDECASGGLSAQEKALEFMLFDLSSCVSSDTQPPPPPPPPIR